MSWEEAAGREGEREGPRDGGGGGWLGSSSAAPAARLLVHSLSVSAACRLALGGSQLRLLARRSGVARAPGDRTARLAG